MTVLAIEFLLASILNKNDITPIIADTTNDEFYKRQSLIRTILHRNIFRSSIINGIIASILNKNDITLGTIPMRRLKGSASILNKNDITL